jgi:CRP/FNR family transcriptional regulator, cyclic AMP receptor protein
MDSDVHRFVCATLGCSAEIGASIASRAIDRRFPPRAVIVKQGDQVRLTFLLVNGRVHAIVYGPEGQAILLQEFLPGDFFGAVVEMTPEPSPADLVAAESVRAAAFLVADFLGLVERYGCVGLAVSKMLLKQLRATSTKMAERATLSATGRVYAELLRLGKLGDGCAIRPAPILSALAVRVQSTRETVSRTINALIRRGILRREGTALVIVAPQRLEDMIV